MWRYDPLKVTGVISSERKVTQVPSCLAWCHHAALGKAGARARGLGTCGRVRFTWKPKHQPHLDLWCFADTVFLQMGGKALLQQKDYNSLYDSGLEPSLQHLRGLPVRQTLRNGQWARGTWTCSLTRRQQRLLVVPETLQIITAFDQLLGDLHVAGARLAPSPLPEQTVLVRTGTRRQLLQDSEGGRLWAAACFPAFSIAQELLRTSLGRTLGCLSVEPPPFSLRLTLWAAVVGSALGLGWGSGRPVL